MWTLLNQAQQISWAIAVRQNTNFFQARSPAKLLLQGSKATQDSTVVNCIRSIFKEDLLTCGLHRADNISNFVEQAHTWLQQHQSSTITGLDRFCADYSAGTTQSFDSFYWQYRQKRMRCFVGEYFYHLKTWTSTDTNWSFVTEQDPLQPGDALIISVPFCDTGSQPTHLDATLDLCDRLRIPVLIDCCYYTISSGININLEHDCIDTVSFSLSKAFPVANLRIGVRYTRKDFADGQKLMNTINYNNSLSAYIGSRIIEQFSCDYIYNTYRQKQQDVCNYFGLEPSQSVIFALGNADWSVYSRKNLLQAYQLDLPAEQFCNRICLVGIYDNWDIFETVKNETVS
jgi:hypothetical protein